VGLVASGGAKARAGRGSSLLAGGRWRQSLSIVDADDGPGVAFGPVVQATFGPRKGLNLPVGFW